MKIKIYMLVTAMAASLALALPADAATKKRKKVMHRAPVSVTQTLDARHSTDVYANGEYVGRDPDPNIRAFMIRNPRIWDDPF
jgi:hypothetical protein